MPIPQVFTESLIRITAGTALAQEPFTAHPTINLAVGIATRGGVMKTTNRKQVHASQERPKHFLERLKVAKAVALHATVLFVAFVYVAICSNGVALADTVASVQYEAHVQSVGWMPAVTDGQVAGTEGQALQLEVLTLNLGGNCEGSIRYQVHVAYEGTHGWVSDGEMAGTTGRSHAIELIKIELDGPVAESYNVEYRAHVAGIGWQDWVSNGELAGTEG